LLCFDRGVHQLDNSYARTMPRRHNRTIRHGPTVRGDDSAIAAMNPDMAEAAAFDEEQQKRGWLGRAGGVRWTGRVARRRATGPRGHPKPAELPKFANPS
jgi:hypothetical protein